MEIERGAWGRFAVRAVVLGLVVFGAVRLAVARDGVAGGAARSYVTVAGTLTGVTEPSVGMTFTFHRPNGGAMLCAPRVDGVSVGARGAFSVQVPIEPPGCPATLFDGSDVEVDVAVGREVVARDSRINPVPYAHYASVAAELSARNGWQLVGADHWLYNVYLRGAEVPACTAGFMTYNIGFPVSLVTTRDTLMDGSIAVMSRYDSPAPWNSTELLVGRLSGYTHSGFNPTVCSNPRPGVPATCYDSQGTPTREFLSLRRPDDDSPRLNVIVPCGQTRSHLAIHIDTWLRHPD